MLVELKNTSYLNLKNIRKSQYGSFDPHQKLMWRERAIYAVFKLVSLLRHLPLIAFWHEDEWSS
ncbi:hypothetical protein NIES4075_46060 [Tolypothrix sp. NIES-4075]|nr:hypothetical protein NIES4075_46060 [Tolypothrix sp. NIES-4075]